jgi:hypothetical protein
VFGPDAAAAGDEAAVEDGGVVGGHAAVVVGAVGIDEPHLANWIAEPEEGAHRAEHRRRRVAVDDQPAAVNLAVEAPMGEGKQAQLAEPNRAAEQPSWDESIQVRKAKRGKRNARQRRREARRALLNLPPPDPGESMRG